MSGQCAVARIQHATNVHTQRGAHAKPKAKPMRNTQKPHAIANGHNSQPTRRKRFSGTPVLPSCSVERANKDYPFIDVHPVLRLCSPTPCSSVPHPHLRVTRRDPVGSIPHRQKPKQKRIPIVIACAAAHCAQLPATLTHARLHEHAKERATAKDIRREGRGKCSSLGPVDLHKYRFAPSARSPSARRKHHRAPARESVR